MTTAQSAGTFWLANAAMQQGCRPADPSLAQLECGQGMGHLVTMPRAPEPCDTAKVGGARCAPWQDMGAPAWLSGTPQLLGTAWVPPSLPLLLGAALPGCPQPPQTKGWDADHLGGPSWQGESQHPGWETGRAAKEAERHGEVNNAANPCLPTPSSTSFEKQHITLISRHEFLSPNRVMRRL